MDANMTGFRCFLEILAFLCLGQKISRSVGRVKGEVNCDWRLRYVARYVRGYVRYVARLRPLSHVSATLRQVDTTG